VNDLLSDLGQSIKLAKTAVEQNGAKAEGVNHVTQD
jgi:hypothetical protein